MSVMQSLVSQVVQQRGKKDIDEKEDAANEDDTKDIQKSLQIEQMRVWQE